MFGMIKEVVVEFNKMVNINSFRISYGLHAIHIALTNFQTTIFEKLDLPSEISFQKYPISLI